MNFLGRWFSWASLRTRISLALVGLTLGLGIVALFQATLDLTAILENELQNRGVAIAKDLASRSAGPVQTNDVFGLYQVVNDALLNNGGVRYIFLMESSGNIRAHTFEDGVPPGLMQANGWAPPKLQSIRQLKTNEGPVLDIAVPISGGQGGVIRVGMSEAGVRNQVASYIARLSILVVVAVVGAIALSVAVSSLLTRPVTRVAEAARRVGSGDLTTKVPVDAGDELGDLARAFNNMTEDLIRSRESLIQRNTELEILNSMADNLSRQLAADQVLHTSLNRLLELTGFSAAWVCTRDAQGRMILAAHRGISPPSNTNSDNHVDEKCGCREVFDAGQGRLFQNTLSCPLIADRSTEQFRNQAVVPIWSREGMVGVLSVASQDAHMLPEARLRLLTSIGRQMGIALENAHLYEELERKERVRADLLDRLISAQEEERRRIAREIHDEPSQELSAVILQLDKVVRRLAQQRVEGWEQVEQARQRVREAMENLQRITTELRPQALDDLGFAPAIRWYAEKRLGGSGVQVDFQVVGRPNRLPPPIEIAAFRISQEAINNVAKHSEAANVRIQLHFSDTTLNGEIADDGKGFDIRAMSARPIEEAGLGLRGMEERAVLLGGNLSVTSTPDQGTRVNFAIPLPERRLSHG